jgi:hypothetical protein
MFTLIHSIEWTVPRLSERVGDPGGRPLVLFLERFEHLQNLRLFIVLRHERPPDEDGVREDDVT